MSRKTIIIICCVALAISLIVYEFLALYNTPWRPFLFIELGLLLIVPLILAIFYYHSDRHIWSFFSWMTRPREKPPVFSCARCQSVRVIIHERLDQGFLHRKFWCKDCGYAWSNIEPSDEKKSTVSGFTLTEILIVLLIVGILVAIALPSYMKFINKVRDMAGW